MIERCCLSVPVPDAKEEATRPSWRAEPASAGEAQGPSAVTQAPLPSVAARLQGTPRNLAACRRVTSRVAEDFGVALAELVATSRGSPRAALARQVAMYLCHVGFALNFEAIGRLFGRDRTTVAHACRVVEDRRDDRWFDRRLALLERACGFVATSDREERGR